jgi:hypothetical protein
MEKTVGSLPPLMLPSALSASRDGDAYRHGVEPPALFGRERGSMNERQGYAKIQPSGLVPLSNAVAAVLDHRLSTQHILVGMLPKPHLSRYGATLHLALAAVLMSIIGCTAIQGKGPSAKEPGGPPPSILYRDRALHQPPPLAGSGEAARQSVRAFIGWAGFSTVSERADGRKMMEAARDNLDVAKALHDELVESQKKDHSRALLVLAILGEMRSPYGEKVLRDFVQLSLPESGTEAGGEIVERTALATLQAKAIAGLAYLRSTTADEQVLRAIAEHPSRIVRAEAVDAYLWNHGDSAEARAVAARYVRKGEEIFLDRVRREEGESGETFNRKLGNYLKTHPEVFPSEPTPSNRPPAW